MVRIHAKVDLKKLKQKVSEASHKKGIYLLMNQAHADMEPYVPKKEGNLRILSAVDMPSETIVYTSPYASPQYHKRFQNYTTPGTGPKWDEKAKQQHGESWCKAYLKGAGYQ